MPSRSAQAAIAFNRTRCARPWRNVGSPLTRRSVTCTGTWRVKRGRDSWTTRGRGEARLRPAPWREPPHSLYSMTSCFDFEMRCLHHSDVPRRKGSELLCSNSIHDSTSPVRSTSAVVDPGAQLDSAEFQRGSFAPSPRQRNGRRRTSSQTTWVACRRSASLSSPSPFPAAPTSSRPAARRRGSAPPRALPGCRVRTSSGTQPHPYRLSATRAP